MGNEITFPLIFAIGAGVTFYALAIQKERPLTSQATFSIIGATAGLLAIGTAINKISSLDRTIRASRAFANNYNTVIGLNRKV